MSSEMAPDGGQRRLSRQTIVEAALRIADAEGLDGLSMRRLAADLGVGTMSLYHHVGDKQTLIAEISDVVAGEMLLGARPPEGWRARLRAIAANTHRTISAHPWLLDRRRRFRPTLNFARHIEETADAVAELPIEPELAITIAWAIDDYVLGVLRRETGSLEDPRADSSGPDRPVGNWRGIESVLGDEPFPRLRSALAMDAPLRARSDSFELGLDWLLDGIEADLRQRGAIT